MNATYLLERRCSQAGDPRRKRQHECDNARQEIADEMERSPSLKHHQEEALAKAWHDGRRKATYQMETHGEDSALPVVCPFTLDRVLTDAWYPEPLSSPEPRAAPE